MFFRTMLTAALILPVMLFADDITITDDFIQAGETETLTADNNYTLSGFVFVEDGAVLEIEAGTVIKAEPGQGEDASALIIAKGGKIMAEGTATAPIIFTSVSDDVSDPVDLTAEDRGLWGGVIVLGKAPLNFDDGGGGSSNIEGIPESETRGSYGGDDPEDNSGIMRYVSIRHGGSVIGADNEINGLTMGAVGSGTTIEYIEVFANKDDGFEWFGGTVNTRYLISAFCGDDAFDYDQGFRGNGQFWFAVQGEDVGNHGGEHDGGPSTCETCTPYAIPTIYNATYIGSGADSDNAKSNGMILRDNAGGRYINSIFTEFTGVMLKVEDLADGGDSKKMFEDGNIEFSNNILYNFGAGETFADLVMFANSDGEATGNPDALIEAFEDWNNEIVDPSLAGTGKAEGELDPRPDDGSSAFENVATPDDDWFDAVDYKGAFSSEDTWAQGWSILSQSGILEDSESGQVAVGDTLTDDDIQEGQTVTLQQGNEYILKGFVFVEDGSTLNIEEGVVIKALPGQGEDASALVVARGGKINAEGTEDNPIIFTSVSDDVSDPDDLTAEDRGLWGGVIVLGKAPLNFVDGGGGSNNIEGIPESETRGAYGGDDPDDNSGTMRYVSIRHGGSVIGADNEINGLTMGAVGSGTTIEYIEVFANKDDGFEWFGGTVNSKYLVSAYCGDDAFDYDQGFRGKGQFWFAVQGEDVGNHGGEHDGGPSNCETCAPYAIPTIYNATYIGSGADSDNAKSNGMILRDNAGGRYINSIFTEFTGVMLKVEDLADGGDSKKMFEDGNIEFANNIFYNFGAGETFADLVMFANSDGEATGSSDALVEAFGDWDNEIIDPNLAGTGKAAGELDPRLNGGSPAFENVATPDDDWFDAVEYKGAFSGEDNWANGWTAMSNLGLFGDHVPVVHRTIARASNSYNLSTLTKTSGIAIQYTIPTSESITLSLYNIAGAKVLDLAKGNVEAGSYAVSLDKNQLSGGMYIARLKTAGGKQLSRAISLVK